ncbi:MAG: DinB family protein [Anaerolineaceae bacterium]|nr:DinB family protein [Anaerolineaceae bacterium]
MKEIEHLANAEAYYLIDRENFWYASILRVVDGLTAEQAAQVPAPGFNSIWQIVKHLYGSHEMFRMALRGETDFEAKLGKDWQPITDVSPDSWKEAVETLTNSCRKLAEELSVLDDSVLDRSPAPDWPPLRDSLYGLIAHSGYHTAEALTIRHMLGLWLEKT